MKFKIIIVLFLISLSVFSQQITGKWNGKLKTPNATIRLSFHISKQGETYKTTMDSPDQGAFDIATDKTNFKDNKLEIFLNQLMISYKGTLKDSIIEGIFSQSGMEFPLILTKKEIAAEKKKRRPQDPVKSYPYKSEEVIFTNHKANNIKLSGTLTLPNDIKNPKAVILISGSGPQNRDEEIKTLNHRPFLVLSDFLTKNGIAVLRYDDRGVAKSEGNFKNSTTADFATDVEAAIMYLKNRKDIHFSKIGLIGHSEGGLIATMVASKNKNVDFMVLLATPGVDGGKILESQSRKIGELSGIDPLTLYKNELLSKEIHQVITTSKTEKETEQQLRYLLNLHSELTKMQKQQILKAYLDKWMIYFVKTNPQDYLRLVTCPVLALNGSKDVQVLPKINLEGIKNATVNNKNVTIKELKGLNHLFQPCTTGNVNEYVKIDVTISPKVLQIITDWIKRQ